MPARARRPRRKTKRAPGHREKAALCDRYFSILVRSVGRCEECGTDQYLQCAHGISRSYRLVRWDFRNAFCLCRGCHVYYTHRPLEWDRWLTQRWGDDLYAQMHNRALSMEKPDIDLILGALREQHEELQIELAGGR